VLGAQLDARPIGQGAPDESALNDQAVASYLAKYVTKSSDAGLVLASPLRFGDWIEHAPLSEHARRMMRTAWDLKSAPELEALRLRAWAHQLGYRGNIVTKSRLYSTTYGALREARAAYGRQTAGYDPDSTGLVTEKRWRFAGAGLGPELAEIAEGLAAQTWSRKGPRPDFLDPAEFGDAE
jgi:hypothetical protein